MGCVEHVGLFWSLQMFLLVIRPPVLAKWHRIVRLVSLIAVATNLEWLLQRHRLQSGRCSWGCALHGASGSQEQEGVPSLSELVERKPCTPKHSCSCQLWLWTQPSLCSQGPRKHPRPYRLKSAYSHCLAFPHSQCQL